MTEYTELFDKDFREGQEEHSLGSMKVRARRYDNAFALIKDLRVDRALDIGCADGQFTVKLGNIANDVSGMDVSPHAIGQARDIMPDFDFRVGNATELLFLDSYFDLVSCLDVLYYLTEPEQAKAVAEIERVLKPQGYLLVSTSWPWRTKTRTGTKYLSIGDMQRLFWKYELLDMKATSKRLGVYWTGAALLFRKVN